MLRRVIVLVLLAIALAGATSAANYMYEKTSMKGVGYKNAEMIISTQIGFNGSKLVEKVSGSGNMISDRSELEAERQIGSRCGSKGLMFQGILWRNPDPNYDPEWTLPLFPGNEGGDFGPIGPWIYWDFSDPSEHLKFRYNQWPTCVGPMDYVNFTRQSEYEYLPISYQTGTYNQKWADKLCVQNYAIGAVLTEMYTHAEHLQKTTEVKTRSYRNEDMSIYMSVSDDSTITHELNLRYPPTPCCSGVLEANLNSNVIGVAHIGWMSKGPQTDPQLKGRHAEYGRSIEDLTGVFSIEKFIQLWGNSTCGAISVDWLPCV
ncbi:MAG: hypothetical protein JW999_00075 [Methanotrichaceae archaeon]|nr:hypothetical protein [Methanotrichaceae archaeon]